MPAVSVGLAEVEGRLQAIRRRSNSLTVQRAVYLTATITTLGGAVVVAIALRGAARFFDTGLWGIIGAVVAATAYAVRRINREWLSLDATARLTDHRAALDDRLATLLASRRGGHNPPLAPVLIEQLLAASSRWDVQVIAPRRVARSLPLLLFSMAVLIATSFYARLPALPSPTGGGARAPHALAAQKEALFRPSARPGDASALQPAGHEGGSMSGQIDAATAGAIATTADHQPASSSAAAEGGRNGSHADEGARQAGARGGLNEHLRQAIRQALGAPDGDRQTMDALARSGVKPRAASGTDQPTGRHPKPSSGETRDRTDSLTQARRDAAPSGAGRGGSAAGATDANLSAEGLLAGNAAARSASDAKPALGIKLGAFNALAPSQVEPQRQSPPVGNVGGAATARGPLPDLIDEQVPDAPLHKVDVGPQHEAIVQRIFTHDE